MGMRKPRPSRRPSTNVSHDKPVSSKPILVVAAPLDQLERAYYARLEELGLHEKARTGELFKLTFIRQSDKVIDNQLVAKAGDPWTMTCRFGVGKGVKGVDPNRRAKDIRAGVITVYQMGEDAGHRCVRVDSIVKVS